MTRIFDRMNRVWLPLSLAIILLLSLVPLIHLIRSGAGIHGIVDPSYVDEYYSPVIREVTDGYPLVGNSWFFEHRHDLAQSSILPYWISAVTLLVGLPPAVAVAVNFSFWSVVTGLLMYFIFRRCGLSTVWGAAGAVYGFIEVYGFLLRPVSMQLVYPAFFFFIFVFLRWWDRSFDRYRSALLGLSTALTFYTYGYLYQISTVFLGLVFMYLLYQRDWKRLVSALVVGAWTIFLCVPFVITTLAQLHDPYYVEMMIRIALVYTHSINILTIRETIALLVFTGSMCVVWQWIFRVCKYEKISFVALFLLMGLAMEVVSFSGLITGIDVETSTHVNRFFGLWFTMIIIIAAYALFAARSSVTQLAVWKKTAIFILVILVFYLNASFPKNPLTLNFIFDDEHIAINADRDMLPALQWLDAQSARSQVVWVEPHNFRLNTDVLIYTKHYVLLGNDGLLQLVSDDEVRERYLLASAAHEMNEKNIAADIWLWGFGGYAVDTPDAVNRGFHQCKILRLDLLGFNCGERTDAAKLFAPLFAGMYTRYMEEILPHLAEELQKYHVAYVIKDTLLDTQFHPERLKNAKEVYSDGRFVIYTLN